MMINLQNQRSFKRHLFPNSELRWGPPDCPEYGINNSLFGWYESAVHFISFIHDALCLSLGHSVFYLASNTFRISPEKL